MFSLVGNSYGAASSTLSVSPTAVDNWLVACLFGSTGYTGAISGGGVTTWKNVFSQSSGDYSVDVWIGQVTSSGSQTITFATGYLYIGCVAQEFSSTGPSPVGGAVADISITSLTSGNFPSITAAGSNELFCGFASLEWGGTLSTSTPGYVYSPTYAGAYSDATFAVFDDNVSGVQSPNWASTASCSGTLVSIFIKAEMNLVMAP